MANAPDKIAEAVENFKFKEGLQAMMEVARAGNKYLTETEPWKTWKTDKERTATILHHSLQLVANLTIVTEPFLPHTAKKLQTLLGLKQMNWQQAGKPDLLSVGQAIGTQGVLFEKIEDSDIEQSGPKTKSHRHAGQ